MDTTKNRTCCFIGHQKFIGDRVKEMDILEERLIPLIERLITQFNVTRFLFGSPTDFDEYCHYVVNLFLENYPHVQRVYIRETLSGLNEMQEFFLPMHFDEIIYPHQLRKSGKACYLERDKIMIDMSDFCVFYYSEEQAAKNPKSGTARAYRYAAQKSKTVINVYKT